MHLWSIGLFTCLGLACVSCTKVPEITDAQVSSTVSTHLAKDIHWNRDEETKKLINNAVNYLLSSPLSVDAAVQVALLNNQEIQATFEDLGIAHADLLQAGLFRNPLFEGFVRFPTSNAAQINADFSVVSSFLDIFLIPLRQKVAAAELERAQLKVSQEILLLAFEVEEIYFSLLATQNKIALLKDIVEACEAASILSKAQNENGNISSLEMDRRKSEFFEASLALSKTELEAIAQKKQMNILLGVPQWKSSWTLQDSLSSFPEKEPPLEELETLAMENRLDLEHARWELERLDRMVGLTRWWTHINEGMGVSFEKDAEGSFVIGPTLSGSFPLFNYGQADRARIKSLHRQKLALLNALKIQISAEVRAAKEQVVMQRTIVETYQEKLLPLQRKILSMSQRFYNGMALGVYELLDSKKHELAVKIELLSALKEYWISRVTLERAVGGYLPLKEASEKKK